MIHNIISNLIVLTHTYCVFIYKLPIIKYYIFDCPISSQCSKMNNLKQQISDYQNWTVFLCMNLSNI